MDDISSDAAEAVEPIDSDRLHELKNRLTVVKGVAQMLDRQVRRDDWQREKIIARVERLQAEIDQLQQLVDGYGSGSAVTRDDDDSDRLR
jgi:nitrogen-specific signal transduction histidine kinase